MTQSTPPKSPKDRQPKDRKHFYRQGPANQGRTAPPPEGRGARNRPQGLASGADTAMLYGYHAVAAALANPHRTIQRLLVSEGAAQRLAEAIEARTLKPEIVEPRDLDRLLGADAVHQGMALVANFLPEPSLESLCATSTDGPAPLILVLDQVTDPHNVGAILRSASVFGVRGIIMTRVHSPPLSGVLAKAASGALEHVPVVLVTNLARAMEELADRGVTRLGLDGDAPNTLEAQKVDGPAALVLGAEGKGLRRLTRENCDVLCRISTFGALGSLNVSNAAAVALHALRTAAAFPR
jgi:23S rRNA (guanosine2251-2'-O)-methyltransferase